MRARSGGDKVLGGPVIYLKWELIVLTLLGPFLQPGAACRLLSKVTFPKILVLLLLLGIADGMQNLLHTGQGLYHQSVMLFLCV
jgi:hypothetical protein